MRFVFDIFFEAIPLQNRILQVVTALNFPRILSPQFLISPTEFPGANLGPAKRCFASSRLRATLPDSQRFYLGNRFRL